ncbi:LamG domain-containing protein [Snuella lapsa]|uniref:LamG-like jellyroll fold domain-containing protein n=1 Tax=Snuella lapsa TaxID=870481 RepID=A0ABP6WVC9_9FLAO
MKNIYKTISCLLLVSVSLFIGGCSEDSKGWTDERYTSNFEYYLHHTNPLTGEDYTEEALAELTYDPKYEEKYAEGQQVDLKLVSLKMPSEVKVLSGVDLSIITTITTFSKDGEWYKSELFSSSLENLGLLEIGDKTTIQFEIDFIDGSVGSVDFQVKRVKFFDPNAVINSFVYLKKSTGELSPIALETETLTTPWVYDGPYGAIANFNGSSDKVEVSASPDINFRGTDDFSIGFWVNTTSTDSDPAMVSDKDWGGGSNPGFVFAYTGGDWKLNIGGNGDRIDIGGSDIGDGYWHYLAATFDRDGNVTLYQDGVVQGSSSLTGLTDITSNLPIFIGQDGTGNYGNWFEGKIGQVTVFDYVLTEQEVSTLSTPSTGVQLMKSDGSIENLEVTNSGGSVSIEEGRFTYAFDGTQYATVNDSGLDFRHTGDFTVATWVKTDAGDSDPSIIGDKDWGSGSNKGFVFAFLGGNWKLNAGDGSNRIDITGNIINDGEWHLIAVTFDRDGNATLYQDGEAVESADMSGFGDMNSGYPINLAEDGTGNYGPFTGKLSNTMLFDYALTAEQIKALSN